MDNSKRNVHNSGPLGMLMKSGQVKKMEANEEPISKPDFHKAPSYFKTQSGIEFSEQELIYVDPEECEPWKYANRHENELGDIEGLIDSIKANKQLQPALIRLHPSPHGNIKYEVIFGRRRHIACLKLGVPFFVIRKNIPNVQDAIASQDAENKLRNDVSHYSNAILYKRLLLDKVFNTEKELADKLRMPLSSFNDLMAYSKIPEDVVQQIPNVHELSKQLAVKVAQLANQSIESHEKLLKIAKHIGKSITSQAKLEQYFIKDAAHAPHSTMRSSKSFLSKSGKRLFTFKADSRGMPSLVIHKHIAPIINIDDMCAQFSNYLEQVISESGYPD